MLLNEHAARTVTLDTCRALQLHLKPRRSEVSRSVILWRGSRADLRLVGRGTRYLFHGKGLSLV